MFGRQRTQKQQSRSPVPSTNTSKQSLKIQKNRKWTLFPCSSTHVWDFFAWVCQCPESMKGGHFSCLDIKKPKKNSPIPRLRQITPKKKPENKKKQEIDPFSCSSTHVRDFFAWVCHCRETMEGSHFSCLDVKEPKKNIPVPRFRQITRQNKA